MGQTCRRAIRELPLTGNAVILKKLHRIVAIVFTPFLLITPITGIILLFRKTDLYGKETKEFLLSIHNWDIAANYVGIILAAGPATLVIIIVCQASKVYSGSSRPPRARY